MQQAHRLYKSQDDRILFGVAGGHAEYFNIDPVIVRVAMGDSDGCDRGHRRVGLSRSCYRHA